MFTHMLPLAAIPANINHFLHQYGALALFALVFLQDVGVPTGIPGTVLVLIGGYLVYTHVLPLHEAAIAIALGAFLGASGMFFLARYGGRPLVLRLGRVVGLTDARLDAAARALDRWGPPMLLVTRVAPGTRVYMTIFAGISGWTYRRFAFWTALFCVLWAYTFVIIGSILGPQDEGVARFISRFGITALIVLLALVVFYYGLRTLLTHPRTRDAAPVVALGNGLAAIRLQRLFVNAPVVAEPPSPLAEAHPLPAAAEAGTPAAVESLEDIKQESGADAPSP